MAGTMSRSNPASSRVEPNWDRVRDYRTFLRESSLQGRQDPRRSKRVFAQPYSSCVKQCIGDGGGGGAHHFLAASAGCLIQVLHHHRRDCGTLLETQNRITVPIQAGDVGGAEGHLFL